MQLNIALDWTPNANHIGLLVAKEKGFYNQNGLEVQFLNPADDHYALTPGKKLELNQVQVAIAPFETVISLNNKPNKVDAVAIYALLQTDLSSIVCLQSSGITLPKQLDGKIYASYKARYEDHIVIQMIKNNGGNGNLQLTYPEKLGIWNTLLQGNADATWIFDNWEGVEAEKKGIALTHFRLSDYNIPYGYSPVMLTKHSNIQDNSKVYASLVKATQKGYLFAKNNSNEAIKILEKYVTQQEQNNICLKTALQKTLPYIGNETNCGIMQPNRVKNFLQWLVQHQLERKNILTQKLYTNQLLQV